MYENTYDDRVVFSKFFSLFSGRQRVSARLRHNRCDTNWYRGVRERWARSQPSTTNGLYLREPIQLIGRALAGRARASTRDILHFWAGCIFSRGSFAFSPTGRVVIPPRLLFSRKDSYDVSVKSFRSDCNAQFKHPRIA